MLSQMIVAALVVKKKILSTLARYTFKKGRMGRSIFIRHEFNMIQES